jgi:hypothetical protein
MRPADSQIVTRERVLAGRVAYHVTVFAAEDGFHGQWWCTACRQAGESIIGVASESHALAWAKDGLEIHHAIKHQDDEEESDDGGRFVHRRIKRAAAARE